MNKSLSLCLALCSISFCLFSQSTFRSPSNPMYWKNKLPYVGYWQQDVAYKIEASIDELTDIVVGTEHLTYYNNSPDTLYYVYFNLYQNAFQPDSYLDDLQRNNGEKVKYGKYEKAKESTLIDGMANDGLRIKYQLDNTVMKVLLNKPLYPNSSTVFDIRFRTFFDAGSTRRRMKKIKVGTLTHYNGCQWYPKICVYDRKSGWNTDQHLNREFYGDFGSFDVELTFAWNYIVEATGMLMNESEVLPDSLKEKLQIRNFKDKDWGRRANFVSAYNKNERKTWKYHADNVHDFAFTADPTYRIADTVWNGIHCVAICQESHATGWQNAAEYCAKIIKCFSEDFGMYEYPKMVVADAGDGMEYPMITMDGGKEPEYHSLLIHEIGHNWFYGMLGNNETYRAMMDEGFTQFLTAWGMEHIDADTIPYYNEGKFIRKFHENSLARDQRVYNSYLSDATIHEDEPINTHSDMFNGALGQGGGYRHVYAKTSTMLYNLQYVLGDSVFHAAMRHYVSQWKMCHPYPEDFRNSVIQFTHIDLNWFFDEWMETTKRLDYKIVSVKRDTIPDGYKIKLRRKERMQMPIDLRIVSKDHKNYDFNIPNTWYQKSLTQPLDSHTRAEFVGGGTTLPKWYGWDKLKSTYTAHVVIPTGIRNVIIDPSDRLADVNAYDNRWHGNTKVRFDSHLFNVYDRSYYRLWLRPDIWYNSYDGFQIGIHAHGDYMNVKHKFELTVWFNTHLLQGGAYKYSDADKASAGWLSYTFNYITPILGKYERRLYFTFRSSWVAGYEMYNIGVTKGFEHNFSVSASLRATTRVKTVWKDYLINPDEWSTYWDSPNKINASVNLFGSYSYFKPISNGRLTLALRSAMLGNSSNYHYAAFDFINHLKLWKLDFHSRVFARIGTGTNLPSESALYYAGANGEQMMENKYMRAAGFTPQEWGGYGATINHLHYGGGLDLRGYSGYSIMEYDKYGVAMPAYKGQSGFAVNGELDFNRIVPIKNEKLKRYVGLNTYFFGDMGAISYTDSRGEQELSQMRFDGGVGAALTIKYIGLENMRPFTIRFDVPFLISNPPAADPINAKFRWVIGINRAF